MTTDLELNRAVREIIPGGGEMGKVVRAKDWSQTPLGPIESWPQSLRTTVNLALASNFPISIAWGPERVQIYNDGYWPICAGKHPHSMGQDFKECWFSAWPAIGAAFERASAGETAFLENTRMFLDRNGYLEETFFTFSFSPIRDESGAVGGLFHPVTELTQQTLAERRLKALRDVADVTDVTSVDKAISLVAQTLARHELDLPFVLLYQMEDNGSAARLVQSIGLERGLSANPLLVDLQSPNDSPWPLARAACSGEPVEVDDLQARFGFLKCGPYPEPPKTAFVMALCAPSLERPLAFLVAGVSSRRPLDAPYRTFYQMLGSGVASAFAKAHAYEEERKRAEALAELDRAKTVFFSNVSHEFRTPLTLLLGPLEDELRENPASRSRLEVAHRNSLRLLKLVNTLLDFSRIEAGRIHAIYEPLDLSAVTTDLASVFRSAIEKAGLRLIVECPPLPQPVYVDREMWEKIVLNLLSNALKFTFEGEIRIALHWAGERVELSVSDTGVGISQAELPRIFERFHRVRGARSRSHEGTGIGLALVQELVKLHGGEVEVRSIENQGTTFTVSVQTGTAHIPNDRLGASKTLVSTSLGATPFVEEAMRWLPEEIGVETRFSSELVKDASLKAGAGVAAILSTRASQTTEAPRILLADDNADMRDYLRRLLNPHYEVIAVADGEAALAAMRQHKVGLVLTDVMMPRLDGFGLLRALREDPALKTLPVILLSARAGEEARVEGLDAGADDYLTKPFSARELVARVRINIELARLREESMRIQEQLKVQQSMREGEDRLRLAVEATALGTWDWNLPTGDLQWSNRCKSIFGLPAQTEMTYERFLSTLHPEDRSRTDQVIQSVLSQGTDYDIEYRVLWPDGSLHWVNARGKVIFNGEGEKRCAVRFIGTALDVTQRKEAEDALRAAKEDLEQRVAARTDDLARATRLKSEFLATMSHELRTPLNSIIGFTEIVKTGRAGSLTLKQRDYLGMAHASGRHLLTLINDLLDLSRIESGKELVYPETFELEPVITLVLQTVQPMAAAKKLALVKRVSGPPRIYTDQKKFYQVVLNLVNNAVKFTERGEVKIEVHASDGKLVTVVSDTGMGIKAEQLPLLFEAFRQVEGSARRVYEGTGLGLYLCKKLAALLGGEILAESEFGKGSQFTFIVPLNEPPPAKHL